MSERPYMTLDGFKTCSQRDFTNGAIQNEIYESLKRMHRFERTILDKNYEWEQQEKDKVFLRDRIRELEAKNEKAVLELSGAYGEIDKLQARLDAVAKLADEFEEAGGEFGDIAAEWVYQELRGAIAGEQE